MQICRGLIHQDVVAELALPKRIATRKTAVTLIEMLIVLAIMTIITAASIPSFMKFTNTARLRAGARDICTALRTARRYAITKRINYAVTIYCTGASIKKTIGYYSTADTVELKKLPPTISASTAYHGDPGTTGQSETFTFTARGTGTAGTIYVIDSETPPNYIPITVVSATGRVKIYDINFP